MHQQLSSRVQTAGLAIAATASVQSPAAQLLMLAAALDVQLLLLLDRLVLQLLLLFVGPLLLLLCWLVALLLPLARLLLLHL